MIARDIILAAATDGRLHACHASTAGSLELIRRAKEKGVRITCEVTPHHLTLTDRLLSSYDTSLKVNPPLRSDNDVAASRAALLDGTIDTIATDHAPHDSESKDCEFVTAANGISGIETAVAVIMHHLVNPGSLSLSRMVELMSSTPARILGIDRGNLKVGTVANITIIDPELEKRVDVGSFQSMGRNNPYHGQTLRGWPVATIAQGNVLMRDGVLVRR
jgi:dihydroorotase